MYDDDDTDEMADLSFSEKVLYTYTSVAGIVCFIVVVAYIIRWMAS